MKVEKNFFPTLLVKHKKNRQKPKKFSFFTLASSYEKSRIVREVFLSMVRSAGELIPRLGYIDSNKFYAALNRGSGLNPSAAEILSSLKKYCISMTQLTDNQRQMLRKDLKPHFFVQPAMRTADTTDLSQFSTKEKINHLNWHLASFHMLLGYFPVIPSQCFLGLFNGLQFYSQFFNNLITDVYGD